eukprot:CAMPEP_0119369978 /NCGR_PEP_ID=MMETSP1334-20130426/16407_1 /TAXON_ID=127549 /ORGANISM="Calcidiscus leptoporus, Strain RCC1130" /LENGTH=987 /DNA_ID=CAMNT_0007386933 /DNA_START=47 /DNA_END=3010 /DNA_ORIENTATION=-
MARGAATSKSAQEILAAVAVGIIAFCAPHEDAGLLMRAVSAVLSLTALFLASLGLELLQEYRTKKVKNKANPFEIQMTRVELPTQLPGGVYEATANMCEHLQGFKVTLTSDIKPTETGFQVTEGNARLRARIATGTAIGWEQGGAAWEAQREAWMSAVWAAPRVEEVLRSNWMGMGSAVTEPEAKAPLPAEESTIAVSSVVRVHGLASKPLLNGKLGTVTKAVNEGGRYGVRLEGSKEALSLHGRNLSPLAPLDTLGVSVPCIRAFRGSFAHLTSNLTIEQAVKGVLRPLTGRTQLSLARSLHSRQKSDEAGKPLAAPATVFAVVTDSEKLDDVLTVIEKHAAEQEKPEEVYVWVDFFSTNLHDSPLTEMPMAWWQSSFKAGLKEIGSACVVMQPWEDPTIFSRAFCVWQLYCVISQELPLTMLITEHEAARLHEQLLSDMDQITHAWDRRAEGGWRKSATAPSAEQKAAVERALEKAEGSEEFAGKLISQMHRWLLSRAKVALDTLGAEERATSKLLDRVAALLQEHNDLESAEPLCHEQVEGRRKKLGAKHADTLEAVNNLALLLHQLGKLEEAEPFSREKLAGCRSELGDNHPDTVTAIDTLSQLLSDLGKLEDALPLKRESLRVKRKVLGPRHPDTLLSVNNLAVLLNDLGRATGNSKMLREAEPLKREALAGCREVLGNRHPHTLASIANLADMLMQLGHVDPRALEEAEPLCREVLTGSREVYGDNHPDTLKSVGNLAALLVDQAHMVPPTHPLAKQKLKEAEPLYREAVIGFTRGLGSTHPTTVTYVNEQARALLDLGKAVDAERIQRDCLSSCRAALGDSHPETLICMTHMAGLYRAQNKFGEAEPLAREVLAGWRNIEAKEKVQRNTLTSINILAELLHAQNKDKEALPLCKEVHKGFIGALGAEHPITLSAAENLFGVLKSLGHQSEADAINKEFKLEERRAQMQQQRGGPPMAPGAAPALGNGGTVECPIEEMSDE